MNNNATRYEDYRDEYLAQWEIVILTVIFCVNVIGNSFILLALILRRYRVVGGPHNNRKLTRMFFFMMHLSIADFITGIFNVFPQLVWDITFRFQGGPIMCKFIKFIQPLGNYLSSYILTVTAIDRYHAICHPFDYCRMSSLRSQLMVYGAWCLAVMLCIPQLFVFSYQEITEGIWDCWASFNIPNGERIYVTWFSVTVFLLPFIVLLFTYISILAGIKKNTGEQQTIEYNIQNNNINIINSNNITNQDNRRKIMNFHRNYQPLISRAKIKTVKQMIIVVSLYIITSSPFIGCQLWSTWDPNASNSTFLAGSTFTILSLLSSLTSSVNPWIYLGFNRELRCILIKFLKKTILRRKKLRTCENEMSCGSNISPSTKSSSLTAFIRSG